MHGHNASARHRLFKISPSDSPQVLPAMSSLRPPKLILASSSEARRQLLYGAGLEFVCVAPAVDETEVKRHLAAISVSDLASALAHRKALAVSDRHADAIVIGADQTLEIDGAGLDKPTDKQAAREQLMKLRGRTHHLHSAVCCSRNAEVLWQHRSSAALTMRQFSDGELTRYMLQVGEKTTTSVGGYQIEGPAIQLFSQIEGDYFTILGLPLLPLLQFLRDEGVLSI